MPLIPNFPNGRVGVGLLLLRLSAAISFLATPIVSAAPSRPWVVALLAMGLILGLWTRIVAALCLGLLLLLFLLIKGAASMAGGAQLLEAAAIVLLGSGAYSTDALAFGRRTIVLMGHRD